MADSHLSGAYDYGTIHTIIDSTPVLHVSFNPPPDATDSFPFPAILPMIGCTGSFVNPDADPSTTPRDLYLHGYVSSRLMKLPSLSQDQGRGTPVCIAATLLDGLVLALTPNHHSCTYRSVVVYGYANVVTDEAEKLYAMQRITNNMVSDRWDNTRVPPNKVEMTTTTILRVQFESASAKCRTGGPGEDRKDLKDEEVKGRVWTGVVPVWVQWGEPVPAEGNVVEAVPHYLEEWRKAKNEKGREHAFEAIAAAKQ